MADVSHEMADVSHEMADVSHEMADYQLVEWNTDEPFLDPEELLDPRVRQWRETLRQRFNTINYGTQKD